MSLRVFAYGSLIDEPEHPDRVRDLAPARWPAHRRRFNLRSAYRGCTHEHALFPHIEVADFSRAGARDSLVLGTAPAPGQTLDGALLHYDDPDGSTLGALDRREGFDPNAPERSPYLRRATQVHTTDGTRDAWVYVTNPTHPRVVELDPITQARVLPHAPPRHDPLPGDRPRGAQYLLPLVRWLRAHARPDPILEALVDAMEAEIGPLADHPVAWLGVDLLRLGLRSAGRAPGS